MLSSTTFRRRIAATLAGIAFGMAGITGATIIASTSSESDSHDWQATAAGSASSGVAGCDSNGWQCP